MAIGQLAESPHGRFFMRPTITMHDDPIHRLKTLIAMIAARPNSKLEGEP